MRCLWAIGLAILLSGCFTSGKRGGNDTLAVYDLGPPVSALSSTEPIGPVALEVRAPLWFDSLGIDYRLAYVDPSRLREYGQARWAGPPAQLIQQRLIQQLGLTTVGQGKSICVLRIEITEFSQVFDSRERSKGVLQGRAQWLDRSRHVISELILDIQVDAPSADSRGGVSALQSAVTKLASELQVWQKSLRANGKNVPCAG
jgi:ABC-type uncharacterized transport system auxiliary subunit